MQFLEKKINFKLKLSHLIQNQSEPILGHTQVSSQF